MCVKIFIIIIIIVVSAANGAVAKGEGGLIGLRPGRKIYEIKKLIY